MNLKIRMPGCPRKLMSYGCLTCRVAFVDLASQKEHYKTDWHRVNLKRKADGNQSPVTELEFLGWLEERNSLKEATEALDRRKRVILECPLCKKVFHNPNSLENHLKSKKHQINTELDNSLEDGNDNGNNEDDMDMSDSIKKTTKKMQIDTINKKPKPLSMFDCLFCERSSFSSVKNNVDHMTEAHGFHIPDRENLIDLKGLMTLLADTVSEMHGCLWCLDRISPFESLSQVRKHMIENDHVKIRYDERTIKAGLGTFYRYSNDSSLSQSDASDNDNEDGDGDGDDYYNSDDYTDIDENENEEENLFENIHGIISEDNSQMLLPSGRIIAHRAYKNYYRRSLYHQRNNENNDNSHDGNDDNNNDGIKTGSTLIRPEHSMHNFPFKNISNLLKRARGEYCRNRRYIEMNIEVKANKLQRYFRHQIL